MSRRQADAVALANDTDRPRSGTVGINNPFPDDAYKRWIASGAIVPPRQDEPSDRWVTMLVLCCIVGGIALFT